MCMVGQNKYPPQKFEAKLEFISAELQGFWTFSKYGIIIMGIFFYGYTSSTQYLSYTYLYKTWWLFSIRKI